MKRIETHAIDKQVQLLLQTKLAPLLPTLIELVPSHPEKLHDVFVDARARAGRASVLGSAENEIREAMSLACEAGVALFRGATLPGQLVSAKLAGRTVDFVGFGKTSLAHAGDWIDVYYAAQVCRDRAALDRLCEVPLESISPEGVLVDSYVFQWVSTLQEFHRSSPQFGKQFVGALEATDPSQLVHSSVDWVLDVAVPEMELLSKLASDDEHGFSMSLEKAVSLHKRYWQRKDRSDDPVSFLALGPTAMACIAADRGWPLAIDTAYVPRALVQR